MYIFSQPKKPPVGYCDPNSELLKYYQDRNFEVIRANRAYEEQNKFLRAKLRELETENFYLGNREVLELQKENAKLRRSLRKMYEKYIKPYQGSYADPDSKTYLRELCPACNAHINKTLESGFYSSASDEKIDGIEVKAGDKVWVKQPLTAFEQEAVDNGFLVPPRFIPNVPSWVSGSSPQEDPIEENPSWVTNPEERPWRKLALKHFNNGI